MYELDAYRAARLLLDSKGDRALACALERITDLILEGDAAGRAAWQSIAAAITALQATTPGPGERMH